MLIPRSGAYLQSVVAQVYERARNLPTFYPIEAHREVAYAYRHWDTINDWSRACAVVAATQWLDVSVL